MPHNTRSHKCGSNQRGCEQAQPRYVAKSYPIKEGDLQGESNFFFTWKEPTYILSFWPPQSSCHSLGLPFHSQPILPPSENVQQTESAREPCLHFMQSNQVHITV